MSDLLAEIRAAPTDRSLRHVYADELIARGDPRGEAIALELQLEDGLAGEQRLDAARRRRALRQQHARQWWRLPSHQVWTRGGFATKLVLRAHDAVPDLTRELVTEIEFDGRVEDDAIVRALRDPSVTAVTMRGQRSNSWAPTLRSTRPRLDTLSLIDCEWLLVGGSLVDRLPAMRELRYLDAVLGPRIVSGLLAWPHLARVERLVIDRATQPTAALAMLVRNMAGLRSLQWHRPELRPDAESTEVIRALDTHSRLRQIELVDATFVGVVLPARIAHATAATRVELALPDHAIEFVEAATDQWRVRVDGESRAVRWHASSTYDEGGDRRFYSNELQIADHVEDTAPLGAIARGIELQRPPRVVGNEIEWWARGSFRYTGPATHVEASSEAVDGYRYRRFGPRSQFRLDTARMQLPEQGPVVVHLHEEHVDDD